VRGQGRKAILVKVVLMMRRMEGVRPCHCKEQGSEEGGWRSGRVEGRPKNRKRLNANSVNLMKN